MFANILKEFGCLHTGRQSSPQFQGTETRGNDEENDFYDSLALS